jgi:hypothetical protein
MHDPVCRAEVIATCPCPGTPMPPSRLSASLSVVCGRPLRLARDMAADGPALPWLSRCPQRARNRHQCRQRAAPGHAGSGNARIRIAERDDHACDTGLQSGPGCRAASCRGGCRVPARHRPLRRVLPGLLPTERRSLAVRAPPCPVAPACDNDAVADDQGSQRPDSARCGQAVPDRGAAQPQESGDQLSTASLALSLRRVGAAWERRLRNWQALRRTLQSRGLRGNLCKPRQNAHRQHHRGPSAHP